MLDPLPRVGVFVAKRRQALAPHDLHFREAYQRVPVKGTLKRFPKIGRFSAPRHPHQELRRREDRHALIDADPQQVTVAAESTSPNPLIDSLAR
jgi:hypothetical protein